MIDYTYGDLFKQDSIDKQLILEFENGETLTNSDIYQEEATITESICSSTDLEFGNCEASVFKVKVANSFESHIGQTVKVSVVLDGNTDEPFVYGTYKVTSDKPTADRNYREIEAYDSLYEVINSDVAEWYETLMPLVTSTCTLLQFRTSFFNYFGIEQVDTTLVNDDMEITKTVSSTTLSGKDVLKNIMSINGCFGHMNRDNKFEYVFLGDTATDLTDYYSDCTYEDYLTETIDTIQIRQDTDDGGVVYGSGDNVYIIEGNFLVYDKSTNELTEIATNLYSLIGNISYRPATVTAKGNPCLEVGDKITLTTKYETIDTFILQRTLKGIQALTDTYTATGSEEFSTSVNSVTSTLNQLAGKTQSLTISLEETKNEMSSISTTLGEKIDDSYSELYGYVETLNSEYADLQSQIDGAIETWFYDYEPTTSNYPASDWTDDTEKAKHIGDLFYIIGDSESAGQAYRYALVDDEYQWILIEDTAVTKALADAAEAKDIADGKRRVFTDTPYPPYDEGDLWTQGETGDILTCTTAKTSSETYSEDDWSKLNKYTDDTVAIEVKTDLANNYLTTTQTESAISQKADSILSTVSTTYTTKEITEENYNSTITNVEVLYALGTSSETAPTSGWSTTAPDWQDGYYMWQKTVTTYGDNYSTVESDATCLTGATGADGESISISSTSITYQVGTSGTTKPTGTWSTTIPTVAQGSYLWTKTTVTYSDNSTTTTYSVSYNAVDGEDGADGTDGRGVSSTTITYQASTSGTTAPTGTWSSSIPTVSAGSYLWTRTVITYTDSTTSTLYSVGKMGEDGEAGESGSDGKGISSITNYYLATSSSSGVTTSTSGWSTTVQTITSTNKYLWNYEVVAYTDSTSTTTSPAIIGAYGNTGATGATGATGVGISSITEYYAVSSSNSTSPSSWSTTVPTMTTTNKYLWNYETITYTDSTTSSSEKRVIGVYGNTGATGATGATGNGISSVVAQFYLSSSKTTQTGGSWSTTAPAWQSGYYVWTRTVITYTDGTTTTTTPIVDSSWEAANEVETTLTSQIEQTCSTITLSVSNGTTSSGITITGKNLDGDTVATASGTINMTGLVSFTDLSTSGSTTINGDNITTGTITANIANIGDWYINNGAIASSDTITADAEEEGVIFQNPYNSNSSYILITRAYLNDAWCSPIKISTTTITLEGRIIFSNNYNIKKGLLFEYSNSYITESTSVSFVIGSDGTYSNFIIIRNDINEIEMEAEKTTFCRIVVANQDNSNLGSVYVNNSSNEEKFLCGMNSSNQYLFGTTSYGTYIRGSSIYMNGAVTTSSNLTTTGNVTTKGGVFYIRDTDNTAYGHISKYAPSEGNGLMFYMQYKAALAITPVSSSDSTPRVWTNYLGHVQPPVTSTYNIGNSSYRYSTYYAVNALNTSSDRNDKHDIAEFTETHEALFEKLQPVTFMRNDGDRTHFGFISQDVFASMEEIGMTDMDFAGFCCDVKVEHKAVDTGKLDDEGNPIMEEIDEPILDEDGNEQYTYSLRYEEFVSLNTHMIQKYHADETAEIESLKSTIADLQAENETLKSEIAQIKEALGIS